MQEPGTTAATPTPSPPLPPIEAGTNRSALLIVFLVVFIDLLGFGIVLPLLPVFADEYVGEIFPGGRNAPTGGFIVGMLMASFSLMQFLFAPVWGRISDRVGRRPILLLGLAGSVVFYLLFGYALSLSPRESAGLALVLLFVARIGQGIAGATIATAQAVIADSTPPEKRKHGMALIGAAFGIGFTFGPLFGYASRLWFPDNREAIGYTAAGLSLLALVLGLWLLPETRRFGAGPPLERRLLNWSAIRTALASAALGPVVLTFFLATLGFASFEVTLALLLKDAFGFLEADPRIFLYFAYVGFVLLLTQGLLYRRLARRVSEPTFMALGIVFMAAGVAALGAFAWAVSLGHASADNLLLPLLLALTAAVVGYAFLTPSAQALISRRTDPDKQGEILGVNQSAAAMARILGPILGVTLYKATASHLLPYLFGAALLALMLPVIPRIRRG
jgi:DHA1 family tetracycline resistance protein-like MFS transporter